jgi:hypothetical protein
MKKHIRIFVTDRKAKQFIKHGYCYILRRGVYYYISRKPKDIAISRTIMKLKAKIRELQQKG